MKKILIASSCAFLLCFTSCATKQAPENDSQIEAPQAENAENEVTNEETSTDENTEAGSDQENSEAAQSSDEEETEEETALSSEYFPEPESIDEPEIITLEPIEEAEPSENEPASEEVKNEEPPEITIVNSNEENESDAQDENQPEAESKGDDTETETSDATDVEDITANDVIIASNQDSDGISGGIDITDEDSDSDVNLSEVEKDITPSRSVTLKKFEYLDVTYPGTGWIYMGLTDNSKDIAYFGRKLGTKDTKFSLQARAAGKKIIHFYRNDPLTGQYLDDYLEVIITAENGSNKTHIAAPDYKLPVQKKEKPAKKVEETPEEETETKEEAAPSPAGQKNPETKNPAPSAKTETKPAAPAKTKSEAAPKSSQPSVAIKDEETDSKATENPAAETTSVAATSEASSSNPATLLQEAQLLYNEKEYKTALSKLNQFFEYSTDNRDEALYLKGQILESKSDVRDIKGAIDAYSTLTKNYPASKLWDNANKRIIYLKRFYLEVR